MHNNPSLDIHVATIPTVSTVWLNQCIESIELAMGLCEYPVKLHVFDGVIDHIGKTRKLGYSKGNHDYVTFVDCDDYVLSNAFNNLKIPMAQGVAHISTGEFTVQNDNFKEFPIGNFHLKIYRRDILDNIIYENHPLDIDNHIKRLGETHSDGFINIPLSVYIHRMYWDSGSRILARKLYKMENNNV